MKTTGLLPLKVYPYTLMNNLHVFGIHGIYFQKDIAYSVVTFV